MTTFILNNEEIKTDQPSGMVMADFIRYHQCLTGTKLGCREGDCGACTVLVGELRNGELVYESMTSCLMPLGNAEGKHIVTVEGVNLTKSLNIVQQAMVDEGGTQCGICTPGFIVSLCGFVLSKRAKTVENGVNAVAGNICRCTGYKSIERAIGHIVNKLHEQDTLPPLAWLIENGFLPSYFTSIQERLHSIETKPQAPITENTVFVGGGTDLYVQRPAQMRPAEIVHLYNRTDLKGIWKDNGRCRIGASTSAEELKNSPIIKELNPEQMEGYLDLISSTQIRHMGTLAGNLVNASPIGDLTIFFLSLNSNLVLNDNGSLRELPLNQFYKGYKTLDKKETEYIQELNFELPTSDSFYFNFEKVSKRTYLDIASTGSAMSLQCDATGKIIKAGASAGGVAAVPFYLQKTVNFLEGKVVDLAVLREALEIAQAEVAPISDVRGTAEYKKLLVRQLMLGHFIKFFPVLAKELLTELVAV